MSNPTLLERLRANLDDRLATTISPTALDAAHEEACLRAELQAGIRSTVMLTEPGQDRPFADTIRSAVTYRRTGLRRYRVYLMTGIELRGPRDGFGWTCFTFAGARRRQRKALNAAIRRNAGLGQ